MIIAHILLILEYIEYIQDICGLFILDFNNNVHQPITTEEQTQLSGVQSDEQDTEGAGKNMRFSGTMGEKKQG